VDPPLPLPAGRTCRVQIDFSLVLFDVTGDATVDERGTFRITYDAITRAPEPGWMRLMPRALEGLTTEEAYPTWQAMLEEAGLWANHSERFAITFQGNFGSYLGYPTDDPHLLSQSLPAWGRWQEPTKAPPIE
jgi:hypothetical protein